MMENKTCLQELSITRLLQAAFDSTEIVRFIVDREGAVLHFNRKAYENSILIHDRELKKGDNLFSFASDSSNKVQVHLKQQLNKAFSGETFLIENEVRMNDTSHWYETEYVPLLSERKIIAVSISTTDISERKTKELHNLELIAELNTSSHNRFQQIELMLDNTIQRYRQLASHAADQKMPAILIDKLFKEIASLKNKVHSWQGKKYAK